ncbi:MAG: tail fiber domain-containing protein [Gracilimonas sp.]|uniref:tail fiber domain-containing protein n=1 Tax=Gracilimonas TaxID=649462 RepID=UPI001B132B0D|nr:tail fiber domain-containing protein [Gracilimonas sp.]MBO6585299.1 tail fiber domain-containing protein [Gracilimonas sp.]MBO6616295.1 tail fiber domain-containing protein [Gracilimonas sp.]
MNKLFYKLIFAILAVLFTAEVMAQVPQGFNFQAVARNADGDLIANSELGVRVSVLQGSETGTAVYTETQTPTTSAVGSFQIVIGEGASDGDFSSIDWSADNFYVKLEIDPAGGTEYEELGTTRLLSVPYALLAENVVNGGESMESEFTLDLSAGDTSYVINQFGDNGDKFTPAFVVNSELSGINQAIDANTISQSGSTETQYGLSGSAIGEGTGTHIGVLGSALHDEGEGSGGRRYGLYGQARSNGRENIGGFGLGLGNGDGEIVALGDEFAGGEFNVGGFNIGLVGFARQNLNGNIGIRGYTYGSEGARENRAVSAEAVTTATGRNIGVQAIVHSSQSDNMGFQALMFDDGSGNASANNIGVELDVSNGATDNNYGIRGYINGSATNNTGMFLEVSGGSNSNVGLNVTAPTAAELNGDVNISGNLTVSGSITETSDRNLKENIKPLQNGLSTIMQLNPTTYNFRGNGEYKGMKLSTGLHYGLIAQEVEEVLPSLVKNNLHTYSEMQSGGHGPDATSETEIKKTMEFKTMNYTELIPVLIKGMQEQQAEIERLKKEIEELRKDK